MDKPEASPLLEALNIFEHIATSKEAPFGSKSEARHALLRAITAHGEAMAAWGAAMEREKIEANEVDVAVHVRLRAELAACKEDAARKRHAIEWALGSRDDFRAQGTMDGKYWWRGELAERAGLAWSGSEWIDAAIDKARKA